MKHNSAGGLLYNLGAVAIGLIISACLLYFMGVDPVEVCARTLNKIVTDRYSLGEILVKATPLIFTSLAFTLTYQAKLFNIGAQGQFGIGAIAAVSISLALQDAAPSWLVLTASMLGAFLAGAVVGALIGLAKARFHANEFLISMMSTYVIAALTDFLLRTVLQETKGEYLQTDMISPAAYLPGILRGTRVHLGLILAILAAVAVHILLSRTVPGFQIRAVGRNHHAARLGGIHTGRIYVISFLISGGIAGLAGFTEINGVQHMLLREFNPSIGSFGIGIAILANGTPLGCIFASILFGFLNVMGTTMGRLPGLNIPASIIELMEGIVMICVIVSYAVRRLAQTKSEKKRMRKAGGWS